jgi:hypothetical protein
MKTTVKKFNQSYPIGTEVLYFPIYGSQNFKKAVTTSEAYDHFGIPIVGLDIGGGGYCLRNIEPNK